MVFLADNTLTYVACKVYWLQQCVEAEFKIQKPICTYAQQCCNVKGSSLICLAICWSHPQCILLSAVMNTGILS